MPPRKRAVGGVLRCGDGKHAGQIRHVAEHMAKRPGHPFTHLWVAGAHGDETPRGNPRHVRPVLEERRGHGPRFVDIEVDSDPVALCTSDQVPEIGQPLFVVGSEFGEVRSPRCQLPQNHMQPDPVHPHVGQPRQQPFRKGLCARVQQRIAKRREIGIDKSQPAPHPLRVAWFAWPRGIHAAEIVHKPETWLTRLVELFPEVAFHEGLDCGCTPTCPSVGRNVPQRLALGFEAAELDEQEVIFVQREGELFSRHAQKLQQLVIGKQMPIAT